LFWTLIITWKFVGNWETAISVLNVYRFVALPFKFLVLFQCIIKLYKSNANVPKKASDQATVFYFHAVSEKLTVKMLSFYAVSVSFHTFTLQEDRCARLLVKNLGRGMPEKVAGRSWNPWTSVFRESRSCDPAVAIMTPPRTAFSPLLHCMSGARVWGDKSAITHRTLWLASVGGVYVAPKRPTAMRALPALRTHTV